MARLHGRWSSRPSIQARRSRLALPWTLRTLMVPKEQARTVFIFFFLTLAMILIAPGAWAQSPVDDVHVSPRVQPPPPAEKQIVDPSLRTHTKPLKVDVDLVLVPVTVTDEVERVGAGVETLVMLGAPKFV